MNNRSSLLWIVFCNLWPWLLVGVVLSLVLIKGCEGLGYRIQENAR